MPSASGAPPVSARPSSPCAPAAGGRSAPQSRAEPSLRPMKRQLPTPAHEAHGSEHGEAPSSGQATVGDRRPAGWFRFGGYGRHSAESARRTPTNRNSKAPPAARFAASGAYSARRRNSGSIEPGATPADRRTAPQHAHPDPRAAD